MVLAREGRLESSSESRNRRSDANGDDDKDGRDGERTESEQVEVRRRENRKLPRDPQ